MKNVVKDMRGYAWNSMYISSIQNGIQGWHAQNEFFTRYDDRAAEIKTFLKWAREYKTIIVLNGGSTATLEQVAGELEYLSSRFAKDKAAQKLAGVAGIPVARFHEPDLSNAFTSVCAVLPDSCYANYEDHARFNAFFKSGVAPILEKGRFELELGSDTRRTFYKWEKALVKFMKEANPDYTEAHALLDCFKLVSMKGALAK